MSNFYIGLTASFTSWFDDLIADVKSVWETLVDLPDVMITKLGEAFITWFTPSQPIGERFTNLPFVNQLVNVVNSLNAGERSWNINITILGKQHSLINGQFVEKFRSTIRNGLSIVFNVGFALAVLKTVLGVFNIDVRTGGGHLANVGTFGSISAMGHSERKASDKKAWKAM